MQSRQIKTHVELKDGLHIENSLECLENSLCNLSLVLPRNCNLETKIKHKATQKSHTSLEQQMLINKGHQMPNPWS